MKVKKSNNFIKNSRKFNWVSSIKADVDLLQKLAQDLYDFYSESKKRESYQNLLNEKESEDISSNLAAVKIVKYLNSFISSSTLEIGCCSGWFYNFIEKP